MSIYIGSARIGENGKITGGKDGDQKQTNKNDLKGEVSSQLFYVHNKGWDVIRPIKKSHADKIAKENKYACNNKNIGYNQNERYDIVKLAKNVNSLKNIVVKCNSDCSSLTRAEIITACKKDVGDFTTANCKSVLIKSGLFEYVGKYKSGMKLYNGDILCTCSKGHVVTVNEGNERPEDNSKPIGESKKKTLLKYYPKCKSSYMSLVDALESINVSSKMNNRKKIAKLNGLDNYTGRPKENEKLLQLLKQGKLKRK